MHVHIVIQLYVTFSRELWPINLQITGLFSIVIFENQVHSAKSILEKRNLLLAKKKKISILSRRLNWIMCFLSFLGVPLNSAFPQVQDISGLNPYFTSLFNSI